jgi:chromate reductase
MATSNLRIVSFAGSLRKGSLNRMLQMSSAALVPIGMIVEELDISEVPLFNADVEDNGPPDSVIKLKESIAAADGLLIVTPEYNYSMPAVTKNLIDWASRRISHPGNVLLGKPVCIMSVTGGATSNGAKGRAHVRESLVFPGAITMPGPDVGLSGGQRNFNSSGDLIDELAISQVERNMAAFRDWILRVRQ